MATAWKKWCPKGCGKRVEYRGKITLHPRYKCETCDSLWTKEELLLFKQGLLKKNWRKTNEIRN